MNTAQRIVLMFAIACLPACSTFEVEGAGSITPDAITGSETVHGSLYGIAWRPFTTEKCGSDSLFRVEYHTNAVFLLAAVATVGLYVPQTVEWWCYSPAGDDDDEEAWDPAASILSGPSS